MLGIPVYYIAVAKKIIADELDELFDSFKKIKVAVLGDVMLDTYWWGKPNAFPQKRLCPLCLFQKMNIELAVPGM